MKRSNFVRKQARRRCWNKAGCWRLKISVNSLSCRVAEVAREHGWHPPKSLDSDKNFKPEHTLFCCELRFVAIYALFFEILKNSGGFFYWCRFFLWILDINLQNFVRGFFSKFSVWGLRLVNEQKIATLDTYQAAQKCFSWSHLVKKMSKLGSAMIPWWISEIDW